LGRAADWLAHRLMLCWPPRKFITSDPVTSRWRFWLSPARGHCARWQKLQPPGPCGHGLVGSIDYGGRRKNPPASGRETCQLGSNRTPPRGLGVRPVLGRGRRGRAAWPWRGCTTLLLRIAIGPEGRGRRGAHTGIRGTGVGTNLAYQAGPPRRVLAVTGKAPAQFQFSAGESRFHHLGLTSSSSFEV